MKLFAIYYRDARERRHVVAVRAATPEEAIQRCIAYQEGYNGFHYDIVPRAQDVVEIDPAEDEPVQLLYHDDYD